MLDVGPEERCTLAGIIQPKTIDGQRDSQGSRGPHLSSRVHDIDGHGVVVDGNILAVILLCQKLVVEKRRR